MLPLKKKAKREVIDLSLFSYIINIMLIDTHSHLQFDAYDNDRDDVVKRIRTENIQCINVGTDYVSSKNGIEFAEKYGDGFYAAIGLHPTDVDEELDVEQYRKLAVSKKVVAIGEIGLDYFRPPFDKEKQKQIFIQQLDLAKELDLPVILHCRMAHDEVIEILESRSEKRGVVHCFTGTLQQAKKYIELGFYLGINGIIFKFNIDEVIRNISLEHLLLETDCPYLTPTGAPEKRNEPMFMKYTIGKIMELKNVSIQEVSEKTTQNAKKLFNI